MKSYIGILLPFVICACDILITKFVPDCRFLVLKEKNLKYSLGYSLFKLFCLIAFSFFLGTFLLDSAVSFFMTILFSIGFTLYEIYIMKTKNLKIEIALNISMTLISEVTLIYLSLLSSSKNEISVQTALIRVGVTLLFVFLSVLSYSAAKSKAESYRFGNGLRIVAVVSSSVILGMTFFKLIDSILS